MLVLNFFFSSIRRHTMWNCDWSSDVCSSDLRAHGGDVVPPDRVDEVAREAEPRPARGPIAPREDELGVGQLCRSEERRVGKGSTSGWATLLDMVGLGGKSAADKGKDTRAYQI